MDGAGDRLTGIIRLLGNDAFLRLQAAHVCVVGLGGVGSWAVEALARSGIGTFTLVDGDTVSGGNLNRQIQALEETVGRPKAVVLADRLQRLLPSLQVQTRSEFVTADKVDGLLAGRFDHVVDAIDRPAIKTLLIARCRTLAIPIVTSGGAAGRQDPTHIRYGDLANCGQDRLLAEVRRRLRREHDFPPAPALLGVEGVYSVEPPVSRGPEPDLPDKPPAGTRADGRHGLGTAGFVTGTFGFTLAARVVARLAQTTR